MLASIVAQMPATSRILTVMHPDNITQWLAAMPLLLSLYTLSREIQMQDDPVRRAVLDAYLHFAADLGGVTALIFAYGHAHTLGLAFLGSELLLTSMSSHKAISSSLVSPTEFGRIVTDFLGPDILW